MRNTQRGGAPSSVSPRVYVSLLHALHKRILRTAVRTLRACARVRASALGMHRRGRNKRCTTIAIVSNASSIRIMCLSVGLKITFYMRISQLAYFNAS